jgi:hypothetical protein
MAIENLPSERDITLAMHMHVYLGKHWFMVAKAHLRTSIVPETTVCHSEHVRCMPAL